MCQNRSQIVFMFTVSFLWYVQHKKVEKELSVFAFSMKNPLEISICLITDKMQKKELLVQTPGN